MQGVKTKGFILIKMISNLKLVLASVLLSSFIVNLASAQKKGGESTIILYGSGGATPNKLYETQWVVKRMEVIRLCGDAKEMFLTK